MKYILFFLFLGACTTPAPTGPPTINRGQWYSLQPPPGHEDQECWYFQADGHRAGVICFPKTETAP